MNINRLLFNAGLKYLANTIVQRQQSVLNDDTDDMNEGTPENLSAKDKALLALKRKDGSVTVMLGTRETGKTELAYRFAQFLDRPTYAISPEQAPPTWIRRIDFGQLDIVPPMSTLIFDDLPAYASNRDYNDALVKNLERLIPLVRHERKLHLIFSSQSSAQSDRYVLDCDLAFFKPLGLLFEDYERTNIRRIYKNYVNPVFDGRNDAWIVRHAYMWARTYRGAISINKATVKDNYA